jgi:hypothetical protein
VVARDGRIDLRRFGKHRSKLRHCAPQRCRSNTATLFGAAIWQATDGHPKLLS